MGQLPSKPEPSCGRETSLPSRTVLGHVDPRSDAAVEQALQVILGERIAPAVPDQGGEGGNRAGIARFELGEGGDVSRVCRLALSSGVSGSNTRIGWLRPRSTRSPTGRPKKPSARSAAAALTQMRVPSCLLTASRREAALMVSP